MNGQKIVILLGHAFVGWMLCAAIMGLGMAMTSLQNALVIHLVGAPVVFCLVSFIYFRKFKFTTPLLTAIIFVGFVMTADFFVVALLINHSLDMFASWLGTWFPFALIFTATYLTGLCVGRSSQHKAVMS